MRAAYLTRRQALHNTLHQAVPAWTIHGIAAGTHALLIPPNLTDEDRVITASHRQRIALQGLAPYWHTNRQLPGLLVGYGRPAEHQYPSALAALAALLADS